MGELYNALSGLKASGRYPFHMPGHKRNLPSDFGLLKDIAGIDITEIEGFDNLHDAGGLIQREQERAAAIFNVRESFFLVGGSSAGVIAAICSQTRPGDGILLARNCHKSAYYAAYLNDLSTCYTYPGVDEACEMAGPVSAGDIEEKMDEYGIRVVCITSPTYEGVVSDVARISEVVHEKGGILIVDEAHGAHLHPLHHLNAVVPETDGGCPFPESAAQLGADLVIESLHKTMPALTQTALLHVCSGRIDNRALKRNLGIFQTSSPSYILMASISKCLDLCENLMKEKSGEYCRLLGEFYKGAADLKRLHVLTPLEAKRRLASEFDPSKVVLVTGHKLRDGSSLKPFDGYALAKELLESDGIDLEMAALEYALAMTSMMDSQEGFSRLLSALHRIDQRLESLPEDNRIFGKGIATAVKSKRMLTIRKAWEADSRLVSLEQAVGGICAEFISCYPPGIPFVVPGEEVSEETLSLIQAAAASCPNLQTEEEGKIRILA